MLLAEERHYRGVYQPDEKLRMSLLNKLESRDASETMLDEWDQRHQAFHTAIVAGCGSQYLMQMRERLFDLAARYRYVWLRKSVLSVAMLEEKHVEHQKLMNAVLARIRGAMGDGLELMSRR